MGASNPLFLLLILHLFLLLLLTLGCLKIRSNTHLVLGLINDHFVRETMENVFERNTTSMFIGCAYRTPENKKDKKIK